MGAQHAPALALGRSLPYVRLPCQLARANALPVFVCLGAAGRRSSIETYETRGGPAGGCHPAPGQTGAVQVWRKLSPKPVSARAWRANGVREPRRKRSTDDMQSTIHMDCATGDEVGIVCRQRRGGKPDVLD